MEAEVIDVDDEHLVGSYSALLVLMWGARTLAEKLVKVIEQARVFTESRPRIAVIIVIEANSEIPDKEARKKLEELSELLLDKTVAAVYVYEGTGFRASATRTLMTMLMLRGGAGSTLYKVVPTLEKAMDWLVPYLAGPEFGNEAERRRAVASLHRRFVDYRRDDAR